MNLKLNIYTDETMIEIKKTVEADELHIPYRVAIYVIQSIDKINIDDGGQLIEFLSKNIDKLDKILKATFHITDNDLEFIDGIQLIEALKSVYMWVIGKVKDMGNDSKNKIAPETN